MRGRGGRGRGKLTPCGAPFPPKGKESLRRLSSPLTPPRLAPCSRNCPGVLFGSFVWTQGQQRIRQSAWATSTTSTTLELAWLTSGQPPPTQQPSSAGFPPGWAPRSVTALGVCLAPSTLLLSTAAGRRPATTTTTGLGSPRHFLHALACRAGELLAPPAGGKRGRSLSPPAFLSFPLAVCNARELVWTQGQQEWRARGGASGARAGRERKGLSGERPGPRAPLKTP